jgi:hypothetical protein
MIRWKEYSAVLVFLAFVGAAVLAVVSGPTIGHTQDLAWHPAVNLSLKDPAEIRSKLHLHGKTIGDVHPTEAVFGQRFVSTKDGHEWIFDGEQWVPHDNTVDDYYKNLSTLKKTFTGQASACPAAPPGQLNAP